MPPINNSGVPSPFISKNGKRQINPRLRLDVGLFDAYVILIASAMGMVLSGLFTAGYIFNFSVASRAIYYLAFIPGFVLSYIIVQMISEKSFLVFHKIKSIVPYATLTIAAYLIMVIIARVSVSTDVPRQENITQASITDSWRWGQQVSSDDPEVIALVREAHQLLVGEISYLRRLNWIHMFSNSGRNIFPINIRYQMENGREIHRTYWVSHEFITRTGLYNILANRVLLEQQQPFLRYRNHIESIVVRNVNFGTRLSGISNFIDDYVQVQSLLDAISNDVFDFSRQVHFSPWFGHDDMFYIIDNHDELDNFNEWDFFFNYSEDFLSHMGENYRWVWNFDHIGIFRPDGYVENWLQAHGLLSSTE